MRADADEPRSSTNDTITVQKSILEQLQRIAGVGAVASSVAHEFNNILTTILNHAKLGLQTADLDTKQRSFDKILQSARRAAKVTTGVLALARQRTVRKQPTDVIAMVEEVLAVLEKDLSKHQIRLERDYRDHPAIEMVPSQIEQVLMNLVINARQAMAKGGTLKLSVQQNQRAGMVEISVRDTGVGIPPDKLPHIFDPFFTTKDGPDDTGQGGSGLGLTICREIVERHNGRIRVETLVGHGTTFTIKLPIQPQEAKGKTAAA